MMSPVKTIVYIALLLFLTACGGDRTARKSEKELTPLPRSNDSVSLGKSWKQSLGKSGQDVFVGLTPVIEDDIVYAAGAGGKVYALDAESGKTLWKNDLDRDISAGVGIGENLVLVVSRRGRAIALDQESGEQIWRQKIGREVLAPPQVARKTVILRTTDGQLIGLNSADGEQRWVIERSEPSLTLRGTSTPLVVDNNAVIAGYDSGKLLAAETANGRVIWEAPLEQPTGRNEIDRLIDIDTQPLLAGDTLYVASYQGNITALDPRSGQIRWREAISMFYEFAADRRHLYVVKDDGMLVALDRENGSPQWDVEWLVGRGASSPFSIGDYLVVGDIKGKLYLISKDGGSLEGEYKLGGDGLVSTPVIDGERLFMQTRDGDLVALTLRQGSGS